MYTFELTKEELKLHISGLDCGIKVLCSQISSTQNSIATLREILPKLIELNAQCQKLDNEVDRQDQINKDVAFSQVEKKDE